MKFNTGSENYNIITFTAVFIVVIMYRDVQGFHLQDLKNWVIVSYADLKIEMVSSRNKTLNTFSL